MRPGIVPPGLLLYWPYVLAALVVIVCLVVQRKRLDRKLEYLAVAFVVCALANVAIDEACSYVIPLDIAGTAPPDPRNAALRALITAAVQLPATLALACYLTVKSTKA